MNTVFDRERISTSQKLLKKSSRTPFAFLMVLPFTDFPHLKDFMGQGLMRYTIQERVSTIKASTNRIGLNFSSLYMSEKLFQVGGGRREK
jgi:hypothetical protein